MPNIQFQFRRGTSTEWTNANPTLASGEVGIETDTDLFKIGNGTQAWTLLAYGGLRGFTGSSGGGSGSVGYTGSQGAVGFTGSGFTGSQGVGFTGSAGTHNLTASNGVSLSSDNFSGVVAPSGGLTVGATGFAIDTAAIARKYSANVGNNADTSIGITHNLNTHDIVISIRDITSNSNTGILADWVSTTSNTVTLTFATAPATNAFRVTVVG